MIQAMPLKDKRVLVPRGAKEAKSFSSLLVKYGGIPVEIPLIAFRPVKLSQQLRSVLDLLHTYNWIIFTSKVTVETFLSFLGKDQISDFPKIAVIGKKTEEAIRENGLKAKFVPNTYVAEAFTEEFLPFVSPGMKVLIPKGNLARDYIAESLKRHGAVVDEAVVYENYMPEESKEKLKAVISEKQLDILMFTSPSTVDHFMEVIEDNHFETEIKDCLIGCIGPVTEKKLKSYGLPIHAAPKVYTVEEMIKSMNSYIEES
jgi:uroporphyrinogen-III synthase